MTSERKPGLAPGLGRTTSHHGLPKLNPDKDQVFNTALRLSYDERGEVQQFQTVILTRDHVNLSFNDLVRCALRRLKPAMADIAHGQRNMTLAEIQEVLIGEITHEEDSP